MLTFEMKSNWVVNNKSRYTKVKKAIEALEATRLMPTLMSANVNWNVLMM